MAVKEKNVMSPEERYKMKQVAAYYLAEKHGFAGSPDDYWLDAETSVSETIATPKKSASTDKLTLIEGIGPKIAELLNGEGIITFADLASAPIDTLSKVLTQAGPRFRMHKPDTWPQQAALARDGKMVELKVLQAQLDGGKVK
jgi:predicted flap endonuclease-1-like 5' DNA nuclease